MKVKSFNDKLNVEIEKNIRMNIEEEMKVRAGKADKKEKQPKKKWMHLCRSGLCISRQIDFPFIESVRL